MLSNALRHHWSRASLAAAPRRLAANLNRSVSSLHINEERHTSGSKALWGGRFARGTDESIKSWVDSTHIDANMVREDIWGSIAHVSMLGANGCIPAGDASSIVGGLAELHDEWLACEWRLDPAFDDV